MIKYNLKIYGYLILGLAFLTYLLLFLVNQDISNIKISIALKDLTSTISINAVFWLIFAKFFWKWKLFYGWLVPFPNLNGTWEATLISNNDKEKVIPAKVLIKQSFFTITIRLKTEESESFSISASFDIDKDRDIYQLFYTYTNLPRATVRGHSQIHYGTVILRYDSCPVTKMTGEYWTSRETTGEIELNK